MFSAWVNTFLALTTFYGLFAKSLFHALPKYILSTYCMPAVLKCLGHSLHFTGRGNNGQVNKIYRISVGLEHSGGKLSWKKDRSNKLKRDKWRSKFLFKLNLLNAYQWNFWRWVEYLVQGIGQHSCFPVLSFVWLNSWTFYSFRLSVHSVELMYFNISILFIIKGIPWKSLAGSHQISVS